MLRVLLAVAAGFLMLLALGMATQIVLLKFVFHAEAAGLEMGQIPPAYLLANAATNLIYAVIGGCITAAIAGKYEAPTMLGALMLGMGIGSLFMSRGGLPIWYAAALPVVGAVAATIAGYRWLGRQPASANR